MKFGALPSKTLLLRLSSSPLTASPLRTISVVVAGFSTSSSSSTGAGFGSVYPPSRRPHHDDESRNIRVSVWWDFENCNLPAGANVFKLAQSITTAVRSSGIKGTITITAFGDLMQLSRTNQEALSATGITLTHVPQGGKNSADRSLIIDLLWDSAPGVLCSAATIVWDWNSLAKGENVTAKHFNQPPDGPYHSWYGHYKVPLLDPFAATEQSGCAKTEELPGSNSNLGCTARPIPKEVMKQISMILSSYPKGTSIGDLRAELIKNKVPLDMDLYGYKKFSRFLLSMPHILKVYPLGDGQYIVRGIRRKTPMQFGSRTDLSAASDQKVAEKEADNAVSPKLNSDAEVANLAVGARRDDTLGKTQNSTERDKNVKEEAQELEKSSLEPVSVSKQGVKVMDGHMTKNHMAPVVGDSREGRYVQRLKRLWFGSSESESSHPLDNKHVSVNWLEGKGFIDKELKSSTHESRRDDALGKTQQNNTERDKNVKEEAQELEKSSLEPVSVSKQGLKVMDGHTRKDHMAPAVGDSKEGGYIQRLKRLWFGSSESESSHPIDNKHVSANGLEGKGVIDKEPKPSTQESDPMTQSSPSTSFESTEEGKASALAGNEKSMSPGLFIRIRKWLKSWGGNTTATELNHEARGTQELVDAKSQASSIFAKDSFWSDMESFINSPRGFTIVTHSRTRESMARHLQKEGPSYLKLLREPDMFHLVDLLISEKKWIEQNPSLSLPFRVTRVTEKDSSLSHANVANGLRSIFMDSSKSKNVAHAGVSVATTADQKLPERSRSDVLSDCQKLVKKTIQENPGGYNIGCFRKDFLEEFGYHLDVQSLGYQKLQSLIEITCGARIESGFIVPLTTARNARVSGKCREDDDSDSGFDELGPVSGAADKEATARKLPEYEPCLSEDEDSDLETEAPALRERDREKKQGMGGEERDSSLIQILDSWYSSKESDGDKQEKPGEDAEKTKVVRFHGGSNGKKQKPPKAYTFVADSDGQIATKES
ncbi:PREDICTED: uncharacterized protein LOC104818467 isoform X2 [Tarenaya hassleriana]|uniref:uncharacterized protein LOC104818467 isoform X2 n=1 Tax=Tarenaya hassleriana TaxID=28532 RepID=UPI00053C1ADC|nr:PREDICTED: uncharacterized protein LOC104818467 isoform X2 [Tarenaya hassleriana]